MKKGRLILGLNQGNKSSLIWFFFFYLGTIKEREKYLSLLLLKWLKEKVTLIYNRWFLMGDAQDLIHSTINSFLSNIDTKGSEARHNKATVVLTQCFLFFIFAESLWVKKWIITFQTLIPLNDWICVTAQHPVNIWGQILCFSVTCKDLCPNGAWHSYKTLITLENKLSKLKESSESAHNPKKSKTS